MTLLLRLPGPFPSSGVLGRGKLQRKSSPFLSSSAGRKRSSALRSIAFFNPLEEPVVKEGLKEPVAFLGGVFAGLLRLDLNEDPLREWITKTVEAAGITEEELKSNETQVNEDAPQEIEIE